MSNIFKGATFLSFLFHFFSFQAQCDSLRYRAPIFEDLIISTDVLYGTAPSWSFPYSNTNLTMNIYRPNSDVISKRPLIIWIHPGGFLTGSKDADDMIELCTYFAQLGYVTATISYRLGFNPLSPSSAERAVYRGLQDTRAAVRFFMEYQNTYGIDTNSIFLGGSSAGSFCALHAAYVQQNEAPTSVYGGFSFPDLGCLDCTGNNFQHEVAIAGVVNMWGALGDSTWIDASDDVPLLSFHGTSDNVVPFAVGSPFGAPTTPTVHGSRCLHNQLVSLNKPATLYTVQGGEHEFHGADNGYHNSPPNAYFDTIMQMSRDFIFDIIRPTVTVQGENEVCQGDSLIFMASSSDGNAFCWESSIGEIVLNENNQITVFYPVQGIDTLIVFVKNELGAASQKIWHIVDVFELPDASFEFQTNASGSLALFSNQSGNSSYSWNIASDTILTGAFILHQFTENGSFPVELTVISPQGCLNTNIEMVEIGGLSIESNGVPVIAVYPNPTNDYLNINASLSFTSVHISDMVGKILFSNHSMNNETQIDVSMFNQGYYLLILRLDSGQVWHQQFLRL